MKTRLQDRRSFLRGAGAGLVATGAVSSIALSARATYAAQSAVTQTKESQAATTPEKALRMLKDGNARFIQGNMLERDYIRFSEISAKK